MRRWLRGRRFDLWIAYYGDDSTTDYSQDCEYFVKRKGAKFPNFLSVFAEHAALLEQYQAVMVADDDLIITGPAINRLFELRQAYDLWVLQPAFDMQSRISHRVTRKQPWSLLRYTNFVEVTCPLFETTKLIEFLRVYDDRLVGWGIDWWFCRLLGEQDHQHNRVAVVDAVSCRNPQEATKPLGREIDRLQSRSLRRQHWALIKQDYGLEIDETCVEYGSVPSWCITTQLRHLGLYLQHLINKRIVRLRSRLSDHG